MGRVMHWLRIDSYEHAPAPNPEPVFQPVPCMQCETAPCEPVCPVEASVHDHEGLNVQVYNRCVGTRFCQSNCPYKVRRFNFFGYADGQEFGNLGEPLVKAANNPDVSVRARGVMEKCTYCVQRISGARRLAERESRLIEDGEIVTACQAACPTQAIRFGNLADPNSAVSRLRRDPRHYTLLGGAPHEAENDLSRARRRIRLGVESVTVVSALARAPALESERVLPRSIDDAAITRLVCAPLMRSAGRIWWIAFLICSAGTLATLYGDLHALHPRRWHLGHQHQRGLGLRDRELCVVDRDWQRRHADLLAAPAHAAVLARLDQPLRGSDDAFRGRDRGPVPDLSSRAPALLLLARALSRHDAGLAAMAQRPHLGLLGDHQLSHLLDHLLVCRRPARSRDAARPLARRHGKRSTAPSRSAGAARRGIGAIITSFRSRLRLWRRRWSARCIRLSGSTSQRA